VDTTLTQLLLTRGDLGQELANRLLDLLHRLDNGSGLIRQVELPLDCPADGELLALALDRFQHNSNRLEPVASLPATAEAVESLGGLELREAGLSLGVSDYCTHLGDAGSRQTQADQLLRALDACLDRRVQPRLDLLDVTRADLEGYVLPLLENCLEHLAKQRSGRIRVRLCDTFGVGIPWTDVPIPRSVPRLAHTIRHAVGLQPSQLEFMGTNDLGLALANTLAALAAGCSGAVCAAGGQGERSGPAALELMLIHLNGLYGEECELHAVSELLDLLAELGLERPRRHPLWGAEALNTTRFASPIDLERAHELLAPFNTQDLLACPPHLVVQPRSGPSGIAFLIRQQHPTAAIDPNSEPVRQVHAWATEQGLREIGWPQIEPKVRELMPDLGEQPG
jgi:2-phosphinomethylmalic acid synthase